MSIEVIREQEMGTEPGFLEVKISGSVPFFF